MQKNTLRISEAANLLGVNVKTLRRWEERGILTPIRTANGHRRYPIDKIEAIRNDNFVLRINITKRKELEIRQTVSLLAKGILEMDNLIKQNMLLEYPTNWLTASLRLHNLSLEMCGKPFPFNIYEQQKYWKIPLYEWPIPKFAEIFEEDDEMEDEPIFYDGEITEYCVDMAREYGQEEDRDLIIFKRWMKDLKQKALVPINEQERIQSIEEYRELRSFFHPDQSILDLKRSRIRTLSKLPEQYRAEIVEFYEPIPLTYIYSERDGRKIIYKCPYCGWTLRKTMYRNGEIDWNCGSIKCQKAIERNHLGKVWRNPESIEYVDSLVRLKSGVREYITVPGIAEYQLYIKLKEIPDIQVELYPDCDACDISIQFNSGEYWLIDVKDWVSCKSLARKLVDSPPFQYYSYQNWSRACVVIPMHYTQRYIRQLVNLLDEDISYEVISFKDFLSQVKKKIEVV
jgi:hypothetical protein